jgi:hypothetical protein
MSAETDAWKLREIGSCLEQFELIRNDPEKTSQEYLNHAYWYLGQITGILHVPEDRAIERMAREAG